jgi:uncharacterized protein YggU (UPF0235/DUF167 family)
VTAAPESGNANAAVVKLIAKTLKIGKTSVTVISGEVSRQKRLHIEGRTATEVRDALSG